MICKSRYLQFYVDTWPKMQNFVQHFLRDVALPDLTGWPTDALLNMQQFWFKRDATSCYNCCTLLQGCSIGNATNFPKPVASFCRPLVINVFFGSIVWRLLLQFLKGFDKNLASKYSGAHSQMRNFSAAFGIFSNTSNKIPYLLSLSLLFWNLQFISCYPNISFSIVQ